MQHEELVSNDIPSESRTPAQKPLVSIVCPCYNEEAMLPLYEDAMQKIVFSRLGDYDFELILINDGSKDQTLSILRALAK